MKTLATANIDAQTQAAVQQSMALVKKPESYSNPRLLHNVARDGVLF